jgi:hypothetical protein
VSGLVRADAADRRPDDGDEHRVGVRPDSSVPIDLPGDHLGLVVYVHDEAPVSRLVRGSPSGASS